MLMSLCIYRVKRGSEKAFRGLLAKHWPALKRVGLGADEPSTIYQGFEGERGDEPIFVEILQFKSATRHRFGYQAAIRTYPSFSPTGALDKIFFRGPLRLLGARGCRLRVSRVASDHLPIVAEFELS